MAPKKPIKTITKPEFRQESKPDLKKQNQTQKSKEPGFGQNVKAFVTDERTRFILGIAVLIGVIFLSISFISYFFFAYVDQSKMDLTWHELQMMRSDIQNWGSVLGAVLADTIIRHGFGIASFAIIYFGTVIGLRLMKVRIAIIWKSFFHAAFWLVWLSITLGYALIPFNNSYTFSFSPGGEQGDEASKWLISYVGYPGTLMILIGAFLIYAIVSSKATIPFLKRLFTRKPKSIEVTEPEFIITSDASEETVAVGTEIIPESSISTALFSSFSKGCSISKGTSSTSFVSIISSSSD